MFEGTEQRWHTTDLGVGLLCAVDALRVLGLHFWLTERAWLNG